ncbi:MAG: peptidylprolyl isomerase [Phycisphaerae bacterium]
MPLYVNDEVVEESLIEAEMERMRPQYEHVFAEMNQTEREQQLADWARENIIEQYLLKQHAQGLVLDVNAEATGRFNEMISRAGSKKEFFESRELTEADEDKVLADIALQIKIQKLVEQIQADAGEATEQEISDYFKEHRNNFKIPEMVRTSHIVKHLAPEEENIKSYEFLCELREKIRTGETTFEAEVGKHSDCPDNGGDMGFFARGTMVEDFEDVAFAMEVGEVSEVFRTEFGFHIVKLTDRRAEREVSIEDVHDYIKDLVTEEKKEAALEIFLDKKRSASVIEQRD